MTIEYTVWFSRMIRFDVKLHRVHTFKALWTSENMTMDRKSFTQITSRGLAVGPLLQTLLSLSIANHVVAQWNEKTFVLWCGSWRWIAYFLVFSDFNGSEGLDFFIQIGFDWNQMVINDFFKWFSEKVFHFNYRRFQIDFRCNRWLILYDFAVGVVGDCIASIIVAPQNPYSSKSLGAFDVHMRRSLIPFCPSVRPKESIPPRLSSSSSYWYLVCLVNWRTKIVMKFSEIEYANPNHLQHRKARIDIVQSGCPICHIVAVAIDRHHRRTPIRIPIGFCYLVLRNTNERDQCAWFLRSIVDTVSSSICGFSWSASHGMRRKISQMHFEEREITLTQTPEHLNTLERNWCPVRGPSSKISTSAWS